MRKKSPNILYSIWRNSDDRLIILDGTAEECSRLLNTTKKNFYILVCNSQKNENARYTIRKISRQQLMREGEE